jgi:hypothetical protein
MRLSDPPVERMICEGRRLNGEPPDINLFDYVLCSVSIDETRRWIPPATTWQPPLLRGEEGGSLVQRY